VVISRLGAGPELESFWRQINGPLQTGLLATDISCQIDSLSYAMAVDFGD
jgi:hypothetical protein